MVGLGSYPTFIKGLRGAPLTTECGPQGIFSDPASSSSLHCGENKTRTEQAGSCFYSEPDPIFMNPASAGEKFLSEKTNSDRQDFRKQEKNPTKPTERREKVIRDAEMFKFRLWVDFLLEVSLVEQQIVPRALYCHHHVWLQLSNEFTIENLLNTKVLTASSEEKQQNI